MKYKKKSRMDPSRMRCPHCGSTMLLRSADGIYKDNPRHAMLYVCKQYPKCDTYVRTHPGTTIPVGTPANRELRLLRNEAHKHFDRLYLSGMMSKQDAYRWLANQLQAPMSQAHIGYLSEYYCKQVIQASRELLQRNAFGNHLKSSEVKKGGGAL